MGKNESLASKALRLERAATEARGKWLNAKYEAERAELLPRLLRLVGTVQKYLSCYSCPKDESDYWWVYQRITRVDRGGVLVDEIQTDKDGKLSVERKTYPISMFGEGYRSGWRTCPKAEWGRAVAGAAKRIAALSAPKRGRN